MTDYPKTMSALLDNRNIVADPTKPETLVRALPPMMLKMALSLPRPKSWGLDDMVQIGLLAVLSALPRFDPAKGAFLSWARMTAWGAMREESTRNRGAVTVPATSARKLKLAGKQHEFKGVELEDQHAPQCAPSGEVQAELMLARARLTPFQMRLFIRKAAGMSTDEIGNALGVSGEAARQRMAAAELQE